MSTAIRITPRAQKYAEEHELLYSHIKGTGIGGAITIEDVKKFGKKEGVGVPATRRAAKVIERKKLSVENLTPTGRNGEYTINDLKRIGLPRIGETAEPVSAYDSTLPDEIRKMSQMQQTICRSMKKSISGSAQTTTATEIDISPLTEQYRSLKQRYTEAGIKLSYTAIIIKAVAMALEDNPELRAQIVNERSYVTKQRINIGCAVDVPDGLVVPVIRDANLKDLRTICIELADKSERARCNKLTEEDLGGATLTITNLGMYGITYFTPVLNVPESLILGSGTIVKTVIARNGIFTPGSVINMSLTHDHRIVNGAPAARFLDAVAEGLRNFRWL